MQVWSLGRRSELGLQFWALFSAPSTPGFQPHFPSSAMTMAMQPVSGQIRVQTPEEAETVNMWLRGRPATGWGGAHRTAGPSLLINTASGPKAGFWVLFPASWWTPFRGGSQASVLSHLKGAVMGGKSLSLAFGLRLSLSRDSFVACENPFITSKQF